jgi:hypothetical protein
VALIFPRPKIPVPTNSALQLAVRPAPRRACILLHAYAQRHRKLRGACLFQAAKSVTERLPIVPGGFISRSIHPYLQRREQFLPPVIFCGACAPACDSPAGHGHSMTEKSAKQRRPFTVRL